MEKPQPTAAALCEVFSSVFVFSLSFSFSNHSRYGTGLVPGRQSYLRWVQVPVSIEVSTTSRNGLSDSGSNSLICSKATSTSGGGKA
jgi:hypothetical protein